MRPGAVVQIGMIIKIKIDLVSAYKRVCGAVNLISCELSRRVALSRPCLRTCESNKPRDGGLPGQPPEGSRLAIDTNPRT